MPNEDVSIRDIAEDITGLYHYLQYKMADHEEAEEEINNETIVFTKELTTAYNQDQQIKKTFEKYLRRVAKKLEISGLDQGEPSDLNVMEHQMYLRRIVLKEKTEFTPGEMDIFNYFAKERKFHSKNGLMLEVFKQIQDYSQFAEPVLITGPPDTGKELVAESLFELSDNHKQTFIAKNVGEFTETLAQSALFGHRRGAFTGATESRAGYFEKASGGTLFLDEIGELSLKIQVMLLRVLESHKFQRMGDTEEKNADVRLIAATNRDLIEAIQTNQFRRDLYSRLKGAKISIPPLQDRPNDIPLLAYVFAQQFANENNLTLPQSITESMFRSLIGAQFSENVRTLKHFINALLMRNHSTLEQLRPWMIRVLYEQDNQITITDLLEKQLIAEVFKSNEHFAYFHLFILNNCHQKNTALMMDCDRKTVRTKLNSLFLHLGNKHDFTEDKILDFLLKGHLVEPQLKNKLLLTIKNSLQSYANAYKKGNKGNTFEPDDKDLARQLINVRPELLSDK